MSKPSGSNRVNRQIAKRGWCEYESPRLGETVIIVRDNTIVPPEYTSHMVRYTVDEIANLRNYPADDATIRSMHLVKKVFGGGTISQSNTVTSEKSA